MRCGSTRPTSCGPPNAFQDLGSHEITKARKREVLYFLFRVFVFSWRPRLLATLVEQLLSNPVDDVREAGACLEIREDERAIAAHRLRVARHDVEAGADVRRQIDLVDHQQVRAGDAG